MTKDDFSSDSNSLKRKRDNDVEDADDDHDRVEDTENDREPGKITDIGTGTPDVMDELPEQISQKDVEHEEVMVSHEDGDSEDCSSSGSHYDYLVDVPTYGAEATFNDLPSGVEAVVPWMSKLDSESTPSAVPDENDIFLKSFKKFDTVEGFPDHYFKAKTFGGKVRSGDITKKMPSELVTRIQQELRLLESRLPEGIFVRACKDRMDFLRAVVIGPSGTPYQDGLFFFDIYFPKRYPSKPPLVHYHSYGLFLNPDLCEDGTVWLLLLDMWSGMNCEGWKPHSSTMLQVLLSIQANVLIEKPYYNELAHEKFANTPDGDVNSLKYNGTAYLDSRRLMLYLLRKPPANFEEFVIAYYRKAGKGILHNLRCYMNDERIRSLSDDAGKDSVHGSKLIGFKAKLQNLYNDILMELTAKGADYGEFLAPMTSDVIPAVAPSGPPPSGDGGGVEDDGGGSEGTGLVK